MFRNIHPAALLKAVKDSRRQMLRMALQTAVAATATYFLMLPFGPENLSWAVIAALFTIGVSADASFYNALGRIVGAFLGVALGLAAALTIEDPIIIGLVVATTLTNAVAAAWPSLRYAAVTAAIVALEPTPGVAASFGRGAVIMAGTAIGVAVSFVVWPVFEQQRVAYSLRRALRDCQQLLALIVQGVETDDRHLRDAVHARFLTNLESAQSGMSGTWFRPRLPSGAPLRDAVNAVESLWHGIVILDRAITTESDEIDTAAMDCLRPLICEAQETAGAFLGRLIPTLDVEKPSLVPFDELVGSIFSKARDEAERLSAEPVPGAKGRARGLHALIFALYEIERRLLELARVMRPDAGLAVEPTPTDARRRKAARG